MNSPISLTAFTLIDFSIILLACRLGKTYLVSMLAINLVMVSIFAQKIVEVSPFSTNFGAFPYSAVMLCVAILCERFGQHTSRSAIFIGLFSLLSFVVLSQVILAIPSIGIISDAMRTVFLATPRNAIASFTAYMISTYFFVNFWESLSASWGLAEKMILITVLAQAVDSLIFYVIAFSGILPAITLVKVAGIGFILKSILCIIALPFLYVATKFPVIPCCHEQGKIACTPPPTL